jgi:Ice-binding-like/WxL domain surface cell wall-binding
VRLAVPHRTGILAIGWLIALASFAGAAQAATPVQLGGAGAFAVLGGSTVTSAGVSTITGDIGVSPGTAVTGVPPGILHGSMHAGDAAAVQGHADLATAYLDAVGRSPAVPTSGVLGGLTLDPGVYSTGASMSLAGGLTLDGHGDPDAVFIFQAGSTLLTAADSHVDLVGGAEACNVFWQVGTSATLGASSLLSGTMLASTSISMGDGVTIDGRALARDGAVTMINDAVTVPHCSGPLTNTAPAIAPFAATLTGLTRTVHTTVGAWNVNDATAGNAGYNVTVSATPPVVNGSTSAAGTGAQLILTPVTATPATGNTAATGPVATSAQTLSTTAATIENAAAGTGQGEWDFPADAGATKSLGIVIPGNGAAGSYSSTLTFTTAPLAG